MAQNGLGFKFWLMLSLSGLNLLYANCKNQPYLEMDVLYMHTYIHKYIHACIHTCMHIHSGNTYIAPYIHMFTCIKYKHAYSHAVDSHVDCFFLLMINAFYKIFIGQKFPPSFLIAQKFPPSFLIGPKVPQFLIGPKFPPSILIGPIGALESFSQVSDWFEVPPKFPLVFQVQK